MGKRTLTESDKIEIIVKYRMLGPNWTRISVLLNINPNTVRTFINRYLKNKEISPKRGRPIEIKDDMKQGIIGAVEMDPELSLFDIKDLFDVSTTSARKILNEDGIQYMQRIPIPPLSPLHMQARVTFASQFAGMLYKDMPVIIFTDESTVEVNLSSGGIWRRRGEYPPGSFYEKMAHPISCMIWGGIGPRGFRTSLIKVEGSVTAESYFRMLFNHRIAHQIRSQFGDTFIFQQDNARPHIARRIEAHLNAMFPHRLEWPAKSPDLSPIEQIWDYLKSRIAGMKFHSEDQLFRRLQQEWNTIPDDIIHNTYSSFLARCRVCVQIQGQNLNGHWKAVKETHNSYRTRIHYRVNIDGSITAEEY